MYFESFPLLNYANQFNIDQKLMVDITRRIKLREDIKQALWLFELYIIRDGDRPDSLADKYYGDSNLHWLILITNDMIGLRDWPLTQSQLDSKLRWMYPTDQELHAAHHYIDSDGVIVHVEDAVLKTPVSNLEHGVAVNDEKRVIKLIKPNLIDPIISEFKDLIRE